MELNKIFIGIDVSKATLDICSIDQAGTESFQIPNQVNSISVFFKKLLKRPDSKIFVAVENTGYYNWNLYKALDSGVIEVFILPPLQLTKSLGLTRGKTDKVDAIRIAEYLKLRYTQLQPSIIPRELIRKIQILVAQRARLVKTRTQMRNAYKEAIVHATGEVGPLLKTINTEMETKINQSIKKVEKQIDDLINADKELSNKYKFATSVQGVGKVLAWTLLLKTNEFKSINDPRKLACYAGVVPFAHQSGTSINKKPKVSFMADKELKKLLHMAAMRAIQLKGELRDYYIRKVNEGKNKMSVLNAVRNKIVARICAMVNNQKYYQSIPALI